jgi:Polyketide cyclase / dehydrase and lipid transport
MGAVEVTLGFPGSVHDAESLWYDTGRWVAWVDGLDAIVSVDGDWPRVGATVVWQSGPAGRGRVTERVVEYEPLDGQTVEVQDDAITGRQSVRFTPDEHAVEITLRLEYRVTKRSIVTPIVDLLFIRNAVRASLRATLARFGLELETVVRGGA